MNQERIFSLESQLLLFEFSDEFRWSFREQWYLYTIIYLNLSTVWDTVEIFDIFEFFTWAFSPFAFHLISVYEKPLRTCVWCEGLTTWSRPRGCLDWDGGLFWLCEDMGAGCVCVCVWSDSCWFSFPGTLGQWDSVRLRQTAAKHVSTAKSLYKL